MAAPKFYDLVKVNVATTGTGTITVGTAVTGFLNFTTGAVADGATVTYALVDGSNREVGHGVYSASAGTLTRTVLKSTNSNSAISLSGSAQLVITLAAEDYLLSCLADIDFSTAPTDGQVMLYNAASSVWRPGNAVNPSTVSARYWRIRNVSGCTSGGMGLCNVQWKNSSGTNLCGSGTPSAYPAPSGSWTVAAAFDGSTASNHGYYSGTLSGIPGQYLSYDFGSAVTPATVAMCALTGFSWSIPPSFAIDYSSNGTKWDQLCEFNSTVVGDGVQQSFTLPTVSAAGTNASSVAALTDFDASVTLLDNQVLTYKASTLKWAPALNSALNPALMPTWRKARARVRSKTGIARILCVGDSTTFGLGSASNSNALGYPRQLATALNARGLAAMSDSFMGWGATSGSVNVSNNDPRVSGAWTQYTGSTTLGGSYYTATATADMVFTPQDQCDTFIVYYVKGSGLGSFSTTINAGSPSTVNTSNATTVFASTTVTTSLGSNALHLKWVSGTVYVIGVEAYNSANSPVSIINAGWSASQTSDWSASNSSSPFSPLLGQQMVAPDLTIIGLVINDANNAVSLTTYAANLQSMITNYKTVGDVMLLTHPPVNPSSGASFATQQAFVAKVYALASSNNIPLLDTFSRWQSYAIAQPQGFYSDTVVHPNAVGYGDIAEMVATGLLTV